MSAAANRNIRVEILRELNRIIMKIIFLLLLIIGLLFSSVAAQSVVRIVSFERNDGIIDRGTEGGIRVGEVFEVNRYDGDFVYWVGRVEVVVVKSRFAGVRLLAKDENTVIQKGDVLELQKREIDPMLDKLKQSASNGVGNGVVKETAAKTANTGSLSDLLPSPQRMRPIQFGVTGGFLLPVISSSRLAGSNFSLTIQSPSGTQRTVNMSEAYASSLAFQAFFALPLSERVSLHLNYAYALLNVNGRKEAELLSRGLNGSSSMAMVTATVHWRLPKNLQAGAGAGLFLPQVSLQSTQQKMTVSDRQLGFSLNAAHQLLLGANVWLRSQLSYNFFLDQGPAVQFLALQVGPSFAIRR